MRSDSSWDVLENLMLLFKTNNITGLPCYVICGQKPAKPQREAVNVYELIPTCFQLHLEFQLGQELFQWRVDGVCTVKAMLLGTCWLYLNSRRKRFSNNNNSGFLCSAQTPYSVTLMAFQLLPLVTGRFITFLKPS